MWPRCLPCHSERKESKEKRSRYPPRERAYRATSKEEVRRIKSFGLLQVEQFNDTHNFVHGRGSVALLFEEVRVLWP